MGKNLKSNDEASLETSSGSVGAKLRARRLELNLTLVELSAKSGVSFATISKIETGKVHGGFQTIYKIARGLGILVTDLMEDDQLQEIPVVVQRAHEIKPHKTQLYDYYPQAIRVHGRLNSNRMIINTRIVPDPIDWSNHEGEEVVTVLSGAIDLHYAGREPLRLETGDSACFDSAVPHAYVSTSDAAAEVFFVSTRPSIHENS